MPRGGPALPLGDSPLSWAPGASYLWRVARASPFVASLQGHARRAPTLPRWAVGYTIAIANLREGQDHP